MKCSSPPIISAISPWPPVCTGGWPRPETLASYVVASIGHLFSPVVFDDLHYRFRPYDQWTSYGQSKSANVLFAVGAAARWANDGIAVNALMPGNIASTALARHMRPDDLAAFGEQTELALPPVKTIEQGAATSVLLAASPDVDGVTGRYYEDCAAGRARSPNVPATPAESRPTRSTRTTPSASGRSPRADPIDR